MQIKTIMSSHFMPGRMDIIKKRLQVSLVIGCGEKELLDPIGGNVNWYGYYGKYYGGFSKKKN